LNREEKTPSPFITDVYGYCSISSLNSHIPGGTLRDFTDYLSLSGKNEDPIDKLVIATLMAMGLADLHAVGGGPSAQFAHNDMLARQFVYHQGIFILNDFNHGQFLRTPPLHILHAKMLFKMIYWCPQDPGHRKIYIISIIHHQIMPFNWKLLTCTVWDMHCSQY
jgi:hypothetical protein